MTVFVKIQNSVCLPSKCVLYVWVCSKIASAISAKSCWRLLNYKSGEESTSNDFFNTRDKLLYFLSSLLLLLKNHLRPIDSFWTQFKCDSSFDSSRFENLFCILLSLILAHWILELRSGIYQPTIYLNWLFNYQIQMAIGIIFSIYYLLRLNSIISIAALWGGQLVKSTPKLLLLLLPATLSMGYFTTVSGLDVNILSKETLIMIPLQILAFVYVGHYNKSRN